MTTILLTGAAGVLGTHLHAWLLARGRSVRATDIRSLEDGSGPAVVPADLADAEAVDRLVQGVSAIVHFGAVSGEGAWEAIQRANFEGTRNIFEAARRHGVGRVIFASSYHVMGFHPTANAPIGLDAPVRPDTLYAVSKIFGETYGRYCFDRYGVQCLAIRICTVSPPQSTRDARNYCDIDDLSRLVERGLDIGELGYRIVYGISDNPNCFFVNQPDPGLGWAPLVSSRMFPEVNPEGAIDANLPLNQVVGGAFALPSR